MYLAWISTEGAYGAPAQLPAFLCNRTVLVHFFSSKFSYFLVTSAVNTFSSRPSSLRSVSDVTCLSFADR